MSSNIEASPSEAATKLQLSSYLTLVQTPNKGLNTQRNNPLVLFFPWLGATENAVAKYCELYHSRGWDVLIVNATIKHFLWPNNAKQVVQNVLDYVTSKAVLQERTDFLVHSMSIGAFIYTVLLIELQENADKYRHFRNKIRGQIFDSIVVGGLQKIRTGIADSVTKNPLGNASIRGLAAMYLGLTKTHTVDYYDYSVKFFHDKPVIVPTLIYYSIDDPTSCPSAMDNLIGWWRAKFPEMDVTYKCWPKSIHTAHLRLHKQEYTAELTNFLVKIQMTDGIIHVESNLWNVV